MEVNDWITDLKQIEKLTEENLQVNLRFSGMLKSKDMAIIDKLVTNLSQNVAQGIDCKKCANCCKSLTYTF